MRIVVVGAGKSGVYLVQSLKRNHEVSLVEDRPDRFEAARSRMPDITTILGDACEPDVLLRAGVAEADLTIAVTGDDEDNLVISMLAKHYGCQRAFARINHPKNEWLFTKEFGVDIAVSATSTMLALIEREFGLGDLVMLLRLQADNVIIEEITLTDEASAVGKRLADVPLPASAHVMALLRSGSIMIASGETVLAAGDQLLLISEGAEPDPQIRVALGLETEDAEGAEEADDLF